uniref:Uncharacterized protein n=1 Tax=Terrapene triunguis TaxID=2587831 RepID=A0A674IJ27_9SAUR
LLHPKTLIPSPTPEPAPQLDAVTASAPCRPPPPGSTMPLAEACTTHEFEHVPVEDIVVREALAVEEVTEELPQVRVVGFVIKPQEAEIMMHVCIMKVPIRSAQHLQGYPLQSTSMGVDIFFSLIRSYFWRLVAALRPCQGSEPRLKYMST